MPATSCPMGARGEVLEQGTAAYLNHIARQDKNFLQLLGDNPDALDTELNPPPTTNGTTP